MDSGMTARLQPQRISTLEQAIDTPVEAGMAAAAGLPGDGWSRVRAIGFGQSMPVPLAEALRACAPAGIRIEMGAPAVGIVGARHGELHLVAVGGRDYPVDGLDGLAGMAGPTLAVCLCADEAMTLRALAAGADGVLYLRDGRDDLARALQAAASGAPALTATAARALVAHARDATARPAPAATGVAQAADEPPAAEPPAAAPPSPIRLTAREREIIMLADQGCTFTQAARRMGVQVSTVYTHVRRLYDKLSVNSLPQALHEARRAGLL